MNQQMLFERAVQFTLDIEGGEVDNPDDPGGHTNFGISQAAYPDIDVDDLTRNEAIEIYRDDYWQGPRIAELHRSWAFVLFDTAVHHGPGQAIMWLQALCKVKQDGIIGSKTLGAASRVRSEWHMGRYLATRLGYLESREHAEPFILGWRIRIMRLYKEGVELV